jgi:hypothetical protein
MSTIFLRIDNIIQGARPFTERFLIDCSEKQEALLRRGNRKDSSKDKTALFISMLTHYSPKQVTLNARRNFMLNRVKNFKDSLSDLDLNLSPSLITGVNSTLDSFMLSPYGIFKILRNPASILDPTSNFRITNLIITNKIDFNSIDLLTDESL